MKENYYGIWYLQIFEQFIADRLELLNTGQGFNDEFEREANLLTDKGGGAQTKYKEWTGQMKVMKWNI